MKKMDKVGKGLSKRFRWNFGSPLMLKKTPRWRLSLMKMVAKVGVEDVHLKNTTVFWPTAYLRRISQKPQNLEKFSSAKL